MPPTTPYRAFLPDLSLPRFTTMQRQDAHEYAADFKQNQQPPWLHGLYMRWQQLWAEPYRGITVDGHVRPGLFGLQDDGVGPDVAEAARRVVDLVASDKTLTNKKLIYHIDDPSWRTWSNPEFLLSDRGVRLDEVSPTLAEAVLAVLKAALSPEGYDKALGAMRINGFLGDLVGATAVMNDRSYNFVLFGKLPKGSLPESHSSSPETTPWGFSFYGHHLCLNAFFVGTQMVLSPCFVGAEPNVIDTGPHAGTRILVPEEELGLQLMQSLSPALQKQATLYEKMYDPVAMPKGRWNHDDQRHLCGASRDNRIVPYEGIRADQLSASQTDVLLAIVGAFFVLLPEKARKNRMQQVRDHLKETYFCWIGGCGDDDPFYYRIQSPVVLVEFDHHHGVFLTNTEPAKFHIHTILRTPNAGDYGMALRPLLASTVPQEYLWEGDGGK